MSLKQMIVTALCLIVIVLYVSPVGADCGWVLWIKNESILFEKDGIPKTTEYWEISSAYPKYEQCMAAQKQVWSNLKKMFSDKAKFPGIKNIDVIPYCRISKTVDGGTLNEVLYCLPGTLDPRYKK